MKVFIASICLIMCFQASLFAQKLKTEIDSMSYAVGMDIAQNFETDGIGINYKAMFKGMLAADQTKGEAKLSEEEKDALLEKLSELVIASRQKNLKSAGDENALKAEEFLQANRSKEGVNETESGLQYEVLKEGDGVRPAGTDVVMVHYTGKLLSGEVFDSSIERGQPATFPLNRVIPGWSEGVKLMKKGAKYRLFVPPALAYGESGVPPAIGPNELLIFEVELLEIPSQLEDVQKPVLPGSEPKE